MKHQNDVNDIALVSLLLTLNIGIPHFSLVFLLECFLLRYSKSGEFSSRLHSIFLKDYDKFCKA